MPLFEMIVKIDGRIDSYAKVQAGCAAYLARNYTEIMRSERAMRERIAGRYADVPYNGNYYAEDHIVRHILENKYENSKREISENSIFAAADINQYDGAGDRKYAIYIDKVFCFGDRDSGIVFTEKKEKKTSNLKELWHKK